MIDTSTWEAHGSAWVVCPHCRCIWPKFNPEHECRVPYALVEEAAAAEREAILQRISAAIGLMNDSPQREAVLSWWSAIRPLLSGTQG
jgi:hypothetical protein